MRWGRIGVFPLVPHMAQGVPAQAVDLDLGKLWRGRLDVDWVEPFVPRGPHQIPPDVPGDEERGLPLLMNADCPLAGSPKLSFS